MSITKNDNFIKLLDSTNSNSYLYENPFTKHIIIVQKGKAKFGYCKVSLLTIAKRIDAWKEAHFKDESFDPASKIALLERMYQSKEIKLKKQHCIIKFLRNICSRIQNIFLLFSTKTSIMYSRELVNELRIMQKEKSNEETTVKNTKLFNSEPIKKEEVPVVIVPSNQNPENLPKESPFNADVKSEPSGENPNVIEEPKNFEEIRKLYQDAKDKLSKKEMNEVFEIIKKLAMKKEICKVFNLLKKCAQIFEENMNSENEWRMLEFILKSVKLFYPENWGELEEIDATDNIKIFDENGNVNKGNIRIIRNIANSIIQQLRDFKIEDDEVLVLQKLQRTIKVDLKSTYPMGFKVFDNTKLRTNSEGVVNNLSFATATSYGSRDYMEDRHLNISLQLQQVQRSSVFAVFDGHSGENCSAYLASNFVQFFETFYNNLTSNSDLELWNFFKVLFPNIRGNWKSKNDDSGSTAIACVILNNDLWVANTGDCRAVMCKNDIIIQLSNDAKIENPKLQASVVKRGGIITNFNGLRVNGTINLSRSIESISSLNCVSARANSVTKTDLTECNKNKRNFLIIACDGLWDHVSSVDAIERAKLVPLKDGKLDALQIASVLRQEALNKGSSDNLTITVVDLTPNS